jgi:ABC-2 type transport system permease protein
MWERILEIVRKEFHQTLRDPRRRMLLVGPPLIQLIIFGYAVNLDVEKARLAWMDMDNTPLSRDLRAAFEGAPNFQIVSRPSQDSEIQELMDHGRVELVARVLPGFAKGLLHGNTPAIQILVDGTNSNTAGIVASYAQQIVARFAVEAQRELSRERAPASGSSPAPAMSAPLMVQPRVWFNPSLKSREYFVPGVVVNIIALVTIMLTAMSIVREKEIGTMEQLMVTPLRPIELMLGKMLPFAAVGLVEVALVTGAALLVFRIPFRGSALMLLISSAGFLLTTLGLGLFMSTVSQTQQQAMMSAVVFFMPALMLSGFSFPIENMPLPIQYLTYLNPLRYFMEIVRGVFLKGTGMKELWPQLALLTVLGALVLTFSALRFRKRLD